MDQKLAETRNVVMRCCELAERVYGRRNDVQLGAAPFTRHLSNFTLCIYLSLS